MKKVASLVASGVMLLGMAVPSFAKDSCHEWWCLPKPEPVVKTLDISNFAHLNTDLSAKVNTGLNEIEGKWLKGGVISTGIASGAFDIENQINANQIGCACDTDKLSIKNFAGVDTDFSAKINSGLNEIEGGFVFGGTIGTGAAGLQGLILNTINTNIVGE